MEIEFITTISLIWLIYTFLFASADRLVLDTLNRLKFALSINTTGEKIGAVNLTLIQAHQQMGVPEIISYGLNMGDTIPSKLIKKFADGYAAIETYKEVLLWNLFILTIHVIHLSLSTFSNLLILKIHFIVSLFLGAIFYLYFMNQFSTIVFSEVNANL